MQVTLRTHCSAVTPRMSISGPCRSGRGREREKRHVSSRPAAASRVDERQGGLTAHLAQILRRRRRPSVLGRQINQSMTPNREPWYRCPRPLYATGERCPAVQPRQQRRGTWAAERKVDDDPGLSVPSTPGSGPPASPPSSEISGDLASSVLWTETGW